jgi:hypothetical protein
MLAAAPATAPSACCPAGVLSSAAAREWMRACVSMSSSRWWCTDESPTGNNHATDLKRCYTAGI